jgi:hypothetical protein
MATNIHNGNGLGVFHSLGSDDLESDCARQQWRAWLFADHFADAGKMIPRYPP